MIGDDQRDAVIAVNLAAELADRQLGLEQRLRGEGAERENDFRGNELDLPNEVGATRAHLFRQRIAIPRRPMLEDVDDEDVFPRQVNRLKNLRQQLAGLPDEGASGGVFLARRALRRRT